VNQVRAFFATVQARAALALLWIYKRVLGPALHAGVPGACCFQPTCSEYAAIAIAEHGVLRGGAMAVWRVLRCNPLNRGGFDPVPAKTAFSGRPSAFSRSGEDRCACGWTGAQASGNR
jgi:uncharacterized protein